MKSFIAIFVALCALPITVDAATSCSTLNLTRCLDSVCAINISSNPAARCQYCGTASAGTPSSKNAMRSVSIGTSAKYTISEKDLKSAPDDPGARYRWATEECIKKVAGCTPDDVSDAYDKLIEQSCTAAGVSAKMINLHANTAGKPKSKSSCTTDITACMINDTHCTSDWRKCATDAEFNGAFSVCSVDATGCDEYISDIRGELLSSRDSAIQNAEKLLAAVVAGHQSNREQRLTNATNACKNDTAYNTCVTDACARSMPNKCESDDKSDRESELRMAGQLCKFYQLACEVLE